ncbi:uncharacterized protein PRCAT00005981001 [Priceomyces carsonii]|uniref:uncharacterized protein n=1 Tax=Priceomyces carsonii TaxID=28549 RepID=UPI002EDA1069|nr:unnamed protein product [Priceomyces carsonii]
MNNNQVTCLHLFDLCHEVLLGPLNKSFSLNLEQFCHEKLINLPPSITNKFCTNCGQIKIPGLTNSTRVLYRRKRRYLRVRCYNCNFKDDKKLDLKKDIPADSKNHSSPILSKQEEPNKLKGNISKTKRKKKNNDLASLLQQRKRQEEENRKAKSLNLMEFKKMP